MTKLTYVSPGLVTTAQLGNPGDSEWTPCAPIALLSVEASMFSGLQFHAVAKKEDGSLLLLWHVSHNRFDDPYCDPLLGEMYCTKAMEYNPEMVRRYVGEKDLVVFKSALKFHRAKIDMLPTHTRIEKHRPANAPTPV